MSDTPAYAIDSLAETVERSTAAIVRAMDRQTQVIDELALVVAALTPDGMYQSQLERYLKRQDD